MLVSGFDFDLPHSGLYKSHGLFFVTTYKSVEAHTLLDVNSSQNDKDFIAAINWKKAEEYIEQGKFTVEQTEYAHNIDDENSHTATSTMKKEVRVLDARELEGLVYFLPTPKSPEERRVGTE